MVAPTSKTSCAGPVGRILNTSSRYGALRYRMQAKTSRTNLAWPQAISLQIGTCDSPRAPVISLTWDRLPIQGCLDGPNPFFHVRRRGGALQQAVRTPTSLTTNFNLPLGRYPWWSRLRPMAFFLAEALSLVQKVSCPSQFSRLLPRSWISIAVPLCGCCPRLIRRCARPLAYAPLFSNLPTFRFCPWCWKVLSVPLLDRDLWLR